MVGWHHCLNGHEFEQAPRGPVGISLLSMPGPKALCGVGAGTWGFLSLLTWILGTSGVSSGESVLVSSGRMHMRLPPEL